MVRLADCFIEVLAYAKLYLRRPGTDYDAFRARVLALLDESKLRTLAAGFSNDEYQSALFAVVAWIDEAVMTTQWAGTVRWKKELLQQSFFSTGRAGVEFFTRLDQIAGHQQAVREVYYFCLMLGFKGKFVTKAQEKTLDELKQHHVAMLVRDAQNIAVGDTASLFPEAYPSAAQLAPVVRDAASLKTTLMVIGLPLAVLLVMYLAYDLVLGSMSSGFAVFLK
jgi:type VI secretion system protein ImpK